MLRRNGMGGHILIIDDNPLDLRLASELLEMNGYTADSAPDAEQAQRMLLRMVPDLILMDIALPGMDGLTLTRIVKADARLKHVPVVALTGFALRGDDQRAAAAGCDGYLTKPIKVPEFMDALDVALAEADNRAKPRR